jgi:hypothetical protein
MGGPTNKRRAGRQVRRHGQLLYNRPHKWLTFTEITELARAIERHQPPVDAGDALACLRDAGPSRRYVVLVGGSDRHRFAGAVHNVARRSTRPIPRSGRGAVHGVAEGARAEGGHVHGGAVAVADGAEVDVAGKQLDEDQPVNAGMIFIHQPVAGGLGIASCALHQCGITKQFAS